MRQRLLDDPQRFYAVCLAPTRELCAAGIGFRAWMKVRSKLVSNSRLEKGLGAFECFEKK